VTARACAACMRHSALIGFLGGRLAAILGGRDHRLGGVLGLSEDNLIAAVAGARADEARAFLIGFDAEAARHALDRLGQAPRAGTPAPIHARCWGSPTRRR